eukprot:gene1042-994_t
MTEEVKISSSCSLCNFSAGKWTVISGVFMVWLSCLQGLTVTDAANQAKLPVGLLNYGAWANPLAYLIVAYTDCPFDILGAARNVSAESPATSWTKIATFCLIGGAAPGMIGGGALMLYGLLCGGGDKAKKE